MCWDRAASLVSSQSEAIEMMDQIIHWVREDPAGLGRPQLSGALATEPMAVPMMLLSLVEQLGEEDEELTNMYAELGDWCVHRILQHVQVGTTQGPQEGGAQLAEGGNGCVLRQKRPEQQTHSELWKGGLDLCLCGIKLSLACLLIQGFTLFT